MYDAICQEELIQQAVILCDNTIQVLFVQGESKFCPGITQGYTGHIDFIFELIWFM